MNKYSQLIDNDLSLTGSDPDISAVDGQPVGGENKYSQMIVEDDRAEVAKLRRSATYGFDKAPDAFAKVRELSKEYGLPIQVIEENQEGLEKQRKLEYLDPETLVKMNPETARFLLDPANVAIAQDDIPTLTKLEDWFSKSFEGVGESAGIMFNTSVRGIAVAGMENQRDMTIRDLMPMTSGTMMMPEQDLRAMAQDFAANFGITSNEQLQGAVQESIFQQLDEIVANQERIAQLTPQDLDVVQEGMRTGLLSLIQQAPGMLATIVTKNPQLMLGSMTAHTYAMSYADARTNGLSHNEASAYGAIDAFFEYTTELIPAQALTKAMTKSWRKALLKFAVGEIAGEYVAETGQSLNAIRMGLDEAWEMAETPEEKLEIVKRRAAVVTVATIFAGGAQAGAFTGIGKLQRMVMEKGQQGAQEQQRIDAIHDLAQNSKTRERDPGAFREHLQQVQETYGPEEVVYMPAKDLEGIVEELEESATKTAIVEQIKEALPLDGDVVIPVSDYVADVASSAVADKFREVVRLSPDTLSMKEAKEVDPQDPLRVAALVEQANAQVETRMEVDTVVDDIVNQLVGTGVVGERQARVNARIFSAYVATKAQREGRPVEEVFAEAGLQIRGDRNIIIPEQIFEPGQDLGDLELENEFVVEDTGEKVQTKQRAQDVWDDAQDRRSLTEQLLKCLHS